MHKKHFFEVTASFTSVLLFHPIITTPKQDTGMPLEKWVKLKPYSTTAMINMSVGKYIECARQHIH